ncbi:dehypoxanthine futalosine cyclase [bacterium]|nr:dehypoxanthine futalosine cyclase [bacterium]
MIEDILNKALDGKRITTDEAKILLTKADVLQLGEVAHTLSLRKNNKRVAYLIDRNINYTNVCVARCSFCAFYRPTPGHKEGYDLSFEDISQKINETLDMGGTRILMQGGLHHNHTIEYYEKLIGHIHTHHPSLHIHAFSPPEIYHVSTKAGITYDEAYKRLKAVGLKTMPGGGAEILVNEIRDKIAVGKCNADEWLTVMEAAHRNGVQSTATMMMGHIESVDDRLTHISRLRELQDKTKGFLSFIPWTFQPENTPLHPKIKRNKNVKLTHAYEYLKFLALSRIFLDNFDHVQVSMLTQGSKIAQIGLSFGADDLGSLLIEENVVRLAGKPQEMDLKKEKMEALIREAGFTPYERDTYYNEIKNSRSGNAQVLSQPITLAS